MEINQILSNLGDKLNQTAAPLVNFAADAREMIDKYYALPKDAQAAVSDYTKTNTNARINFDRLSELLASVPSASIADVILVSDKGQSVSQGGRSEAYDRILDAQIKQAAVARAGAEAAARKTGEDREQTGKDVKTTMENVAQTAADRGQTSVDREQTGRDAKKTGEDVKTTMENVAQTAADRDQTTRDRTQTGEDVRTTENNASRTAADREQTGKDSKQTSIDVSRTAADRGQTSADREQTGKDRDAAGNARKGAEKAQWKSELAASATKLDAYNTAISRQAEHNERVELPKQVGALRGKAENLNDEIKKTSGLSMALLNDKNSISYKEIYDYGIEQAAKNKGKPDTRIVEWNRDGHAVIKGNGVITIKPLLGKAAIVNNLTIEQMDRGDIVLLDTSHLNNNQTVTRMADKRNFGHGKIMLTAREGDTLDVKDIAGGVVVKIGGKTVTLNGFNREDVMIGTGENGQVNAKVASLSAWQTALEVDHQKRMDGALAQYNDQRAAVIKAADVDFDKSRGASNGITPNEAEAALRAIKNNGKQDGGEFSVDAGPVRRTLAAVIANGGMSVKGALKQLDQEISVQKDLPKSAPIGAKQGASHAPGNK